MKFDSEDDAWNYWEENIYYGQGEGYVGLGRNFDQKVDLFKEWLRENDIMCNL